MLVLSYRSRADFSSAGNIRCWEEEQQLGLAWGRVFWLRSSCHGGNRKMLVGAPGQRLSHPWGAGRAVSKHTGHGV